MLSIVLPVLLAQVVLAQSYPSATIKNADVTVQIYLPDASKGFYRGTRFDWSGVISSLTWKGHEYFGRWYAKHDPLVHDAITGPVDIFDTDGAGLGYSEARTGEGFIRIGVGVVEKPEESAYRGTNTYRIVDPGKWHVHRTDRSITFEQQLVGPRGHAYSYSKTISLDPARPEMVLSHVLKNTGAKTIDTTVFNHGFFQIDGEPAGPNLVWSFPWKPQAKDDFGGMAEVRGSQVVYLRELRDGERVFQPLLGYGPSAHDHQFSLENRKTGAAVRVTSNQPITKLNFWSRRLAYAPEPYIHLHIPPGASRTWESTYQFYLAK